MREENADRALELLNDRYVAKLIKTMCESGHMPLSGSTYVASAATLSDSDLCTGSSCASLTDSSIHAKSFSSTLQEAS